MTYGDAGPGASGPDPARPADVDPGWYPDPWVAGSRRYWSGTQWTSLAFPDRTVDDRAGAAARAGETNPFAERSAAPAVAPPAPVWVAPSPVAAAPVAWDPAPVAAPGTPTRWPLALVVGAVVIALALAGLVATRGQDSTATAAPRPPAAPTLPAQPTPTPTPSPTPSGAPSQPTRPGDLADLARLGLRQSDVATGVLVLPIDGGTQVQGETTLDLCSGKFPSESLRQARVQVVGIESDGTVGLSTETVRYASPAAVEQAWSEIQTVASRCSTTAPDTTLGPAPDTTWPPVAGVRRLAYDSITTDSAGVTTHSTIVYLSRGNILMGVYFPRPGGTQLSVEGRTTVPSIVAVFEERLRQLPPSGVAGGTESPGAVGPTA